MSAKAFVDTNILLYARDTSEPAKQEIAEALLRRLWSERTGCLSVQVLNEYFVNATRKLAFPLTPDEAWEDVDALMAWRPVGMDEALLTEGFRFHRRYGLSWWDALVVAAAERAGCGTLYSEDLSADQRYGSVCVVNPFAQPALQAKP
jgi:predicted nucleic acid-binding protein